MNKKLIRLSESDLHNIVKESVNKVLTELDWRTYASAAKKRDAQIQQLGPDATDKGGNRLTHLRNNLHVTEGRFFRYNKRTVPLLY